jgi:hypothetical protein
MKLSLGLSPRDYSVSGGAVAYDTDAQAYFTANTTITSDADKNAINTFYLGLKSDGVYTKIKAMYLPIWGSASSSKWNLINNRTFDLTFATGMTFTSSGITSNGTTGYANTNFLPSTNLSSNSVHLNFYSRSNIDAFTFDVGAKNGSFGGNPTLGIISRASGSMFSYANVNESTNRLINTNASSLGLHTMSRNGTTTVTHFRNATSLGSGVRTELIVVNFNLFICAQNTTGTPSLYSTRQCAFTSVGDGLSNAEVTNFYNRVNTLMTYFGINV